MPRILVVYYSRTGTTKRAATMIANSLGADVEAISDHAQRLGFAGYGRCASEAWRQQITDIDRSTSDLKQYDLIVVGTPIWCLSLSSPVRSWIRRYRDQMKAVAFFCTCGGHGGARVFRQMRTEGGKDPLASLVLREVDFVRDTAAPAIRRFADRILEDLHDGNPRGAPLAGDSLMGATT